LNTYGSTTSHTNGALVVVINNELTQLQSTNHISLKKGQD